MVQRTKNQPFTMVTSLFRSVVIFAQCLLALSQQQPPYELIVQRQQESSTGSAVDLITLRCRNTQSGSFEPVRDVIFWFNRATPDDPGINNEPGVFQDRTGIVFQLQRESREGNYTCGVRIDQANVMESERVTLIGKITELIEFRCLQGIILCQ